MFIQHRKVITTETWTSVSYPDDANEPATAGFIVSYILWRVTAESLVWDLFLYRVHIRELNEINNIRKPYLNVTLTPFLRPGLKAVQVNDKPTPFDIISEQIEICPGFSWAWVQGPILDHRRSPGSQLYTLSHHHKSALAQQGRKSLDTLTYYTIIML